MHCYASLTYCLLYDILQSVAALAERSARLLRRRHRRGVSRETFAAALAVPHSPPEHLREHQRRIVALAAVVALLDENENLLIFR